MFRCTLVDTRKTARSISKSLNVLRNYFVVYFQNVLKIQMSCTNSHESQLVISKTQMNKITCQERVHNPPSRQNLSPSKGPLHPPPSGPHHPHTSSDPNFLLQRSTLSSLSLPPCDLATSPSFKEKSELTSQIL